MKGRKIDGEYFARVISNELSTTIARRVLPWEIRPLKRWLATSCARWRRKATPESKAH